MNTSCLLFFQEAVRLVCTCSPPLLTSPSYSSSSFTVSLVKFAQSYSSSSSSSSSSRFLVLPLAPLLLPLFLPSPLLHPAPPLLVPLSLVLLLPLLLSTLHLLILLLPPPPPPPPFNYFSSSYSSSSPPSLPHSHRLLCVSAWGLGDCGRAALLWQRAMLPNCGTPGIWSLSLLSPLFIPPSSQFFFPLVQQWLSTPPARFLHLHPSFSAVYHPQKCSHIRNETHMLRNEKDGTKK